MNAAGHIERYKEIMVANGLSQKPGNDFRKSYLPVLKYGTLWYVSVLVGRHRLKMVQVSVKSNFLNEDLQEEMAIAQPKVFVLDGQEGKVMRLHEELYGLR